MNALSVLKNRAFKISLHVLHAIVMLFSTYYLFFESLTSQSVANSYSTRYTFVMLSILLAHMYLHFILMACKTKLNLSREYLYFFIIAVIAFCLCGLIFLTVPAEIRIQNDGADKISAALSLWHNQQYKIIHSGFWNNDALHPLYRFNPSRPPLFPYLLACFHRLLGYKFENVFLLNFVLAGFLFTLLGIALKFMNSKRLSVAAILFFASHPVVSLYSASDDYAILFALIFLASLFCVVKYFKNINSSKLGLAVILCCLLANIRPESIAISLVIMIILFIHSIIFRSFTYTYFWIPIFLLPALWVRISCGFTYNGAKMKALDAGLHGGMLPLFQYSFKSIIHNSTSFLNLISDFNYEMPYADIVAILGIFGMLLWAATLIVNAKKINKSCWFATLIIVSSVLTYWLITTRFGSPGDRRTVRYYIFATLILSSFATYLFYRLKMNKTLVLIVAITIFALHHPFAIKNYIHKKDSTRATTYHIAISYLAPIKPDRILIFSKVPRFYLVHGFSAVSFKTAGERYRKYIAKLQNSTFNRILVVQKLHNNNRPFQGYALSKKYKTKILYEAPQDSRSKVRVSEIVFE